MSDDFDDIVGGQITELGAMAMQLHELYESYREAGFSEWQAFTLVRDIQRSGMGGS